MWTGPATVLRCRLMGSLPTSLTPRSYDRAPGRRHLRTATCGFFAHRRGAEFCHVHGVAAHSVDGDQGRCGLRLRMARRATSPSTLWTAASAKTGAEDWYARARTI